jgi:exoribonuclease II
MKIDDRYWKIIEEIKKHPLKTSDNFLTKLKQKIKENTNGTTRSNK